MRYYNLTFDSYSGVLDNKHTYSKDTKESVDVDNNGKLLVKETEVAKYFDKYNIFSAEYMGTTIE